MPVMARRLALLWALLLPLVGLACSRPYQVGDHVLVEWGDEGHLYPAYIVRAKSRSAFRVHFEGYPARFDEDVGLPRIHGRAQSGAPHPPPPRHVRLLQGGDDPSPGEKQLARYKVGDKVRVSWRGSVYRATVLAVKSPTEFEIHYEGYESAWDEVVPAARIVTTP